MTSRYHHYIILCISAIFVLLSACGPSKYLNEDEYLLDKYKIDDQRSDLSKEEFRNYIKQTPNKKILGFPFWLHLYNIAGDDMDKGINRWLKNIGEQPVIYNPDLTENTTRQLELLLFNEGYFDAEVADSAVFDDRKVKVLYTLNPGEEYVIRNIDYFFQDASISGYVLEDSSSTLLNQGDRYDLDNFRAENIRIENLLKDKGYYNFSRDFIKYEIDTTVGNHQFDVLMQVENYPVFDENGRLIRTTHPVYTIRNVYINNIESTSSTSSGSANQPAADTIQFDSVYIIGKDKISLRSGLLTQKNYIIPGEKYNLRRVSQTYRNLASLSALRLVDVNFKEVDTLNRLLDCNITLLPSVRQAFTGGIEGTTTGGNIGVAGNLNYQHRNLFGGSEKFDVTLLGAIESLSENPKAIQYGSGSMQELGIEAKLSLPQFLLPVRTDQFIRKYNHETDINLAYNFQKRPDFTRSTFRSSFGYRWKGNRYLTHYIYPIDISLINTPVIDADFKEWLSGTYLYYSYLPHFITDQRYRLVYSNQKINKPVDFNYLRFGFETAGNIMYGLFHALGNVENDAVLQLFGVDYAQYVRADLDIRHYDYFYNGNSLVYRAFAGAAIPYLNSTAIPFEKQFFGGGANSLRAWRVKNLGPGSFEGDTISRYPNQTADLKLEVNLEYRFHLFWKIEGALFLDAGNIWALSREDDRKGALFNLNDFYKEFAVGTGFGFRFDFEFFVFRFDLGIPLADPSYPEGQRWIPSNYNLQWNDLGYNFAIGYPF